MALSPQVTHSRHETSLEGDKLKFDWFTRMEALHGLRGVAENDNRRNEHLETEIVISGDRLSLCSMQSE